jgi:ribonuclease Z
MIHDVSMNAKHILLTHFSARIPQGRPSSTEVHNGTISYAIDHAHLRVGDMWKMAHYLPAVKQTLDAVDDAEGEAEEEEARVRAMGMVNL